MFQTNQWLGLLPKLCASEMLVFFPPCCTYAAAIYPHRSLRSSTTIWSGVLHHGDPAWLFLIYVISLMLCSCLLINSVRVVKFLFGKQLCSAESRRELTVSQLWRESPGMSSIPSVHTVLCIDGLTRAIEVETSGWDFNTSLLCLFSFRVPLQQGFLSSF